MRFIKSYNLFENVQQAKSILKSLNIDQSDKSFQEIRNILKGHEGYVGWFTKLFYVQKYGMSDLYELYDYIKTNSAFISMLKKNIIDYDNIEKLQDDVEIVKSESQLRRIINEFPSRQRALLDTKKDASLLDALARRKDFKGFFKKIASYHTRTQLLDNLKIFLKTDPNASLDNIMSIAKKNGSEIKHFSYEDNILIVRVFNSSQLNDVAGDCSWCIRNSGTFRSYVNDTTGKQYIVFLFDRTDNLSRIGVTMDLKRTDSSFYYTAHNRVDQRVSYESLKEILAEYNYNVSELGFKLSDINPNLTPVKDLEKSFGLSKEEIIKIKTLFKPDDISRFTKEEIEKWDLLEKSSIDMKTLEKYSFEEIVSKNLFKRVENIYISSIIHLYRNLGYKLIDYLKKNKEVLNQLSSHGNRDGKSDYQFYKEYILDGKAPESTSSLEVGSRWSDKNRYNFYQTIFRILWFKDDINQLIETETKKLHRFYRPEKGDERTEEEVNRDRSLRNIIDSFEDYAYVECVRLFLEELEVPTEEFLNLIKRRKTEEYLKSTIEYYKLIGKDYSNIRDIYFKVIKSSKISEYNLSTYKSILTDEQYDEITQEKQDQEFRSELSYYKPYDNKCNTKDSEKFYEKWGKYLQKKDRISGRYYDRYYELAIILIYTRVDKLNELNRIDISFKSYAGQELVKYINEILCGTYRTNGGMREPLTEDQCKKLYRWMVSHDLSDLTLGRYSSKEHPDGVYEVHEGDPRRYYLASMYLYDREGYDEYVTYYASNVKYNVRKDAGFSSTGILPRPGDKKMYTTIRTAEMSPMIEFFEEGKKKGNNWLNEYKDMIKEMLSWNLSISEVTYLLESWRVKNEEVRKLLLDELVRKKASPKTVHKYMYPKRESRW